MNNKETNLKEKLKQALTSTIKVISDDIKINDHKENDKKEKSSQSFEINDLMEGVNVLLKGKITMAEITKKFEVCLLVSFLFNILYLLPHLLNKYF